MSTKKKTNFDYLRGLLNADQGEAEEFLDAIENEFNEKDTEITSLSNQERINESIIQNLKVELVEYNYSIDAGLGIIEYRIKTENLQLQTLMEALQAAITKWTPRKVEDVLASL